MQGLKFGVWKFGVWVLDLEAEVRLVEQLLAVPPGPARVRL